MPIVKKQNAEFRADAKVSVADLANGSSAASGTDAEKRDTVGKQVEVVRSANGDITQINVRCECGKITSVTCEY